MRPASWMASRNFPAAARTVSVVQRQRRVDAGDRQRRSIPAHFADEAFDRLGAGGFAGEIRHVERVEIAGREEPIHGLQPDVVGIDVVRLVPAERLHRGVRLGPDIVGPAVDDGVFAVGLVPDRVNAQAGVTRLENGLELRAALAGKAVAHAEGVFFDVHNGGSKR